MMSFMQKKMVVIAIVAIARGNGVVASDKAGASASASPVGNAAAAAAVEAVPRRVDDAVGAAEEGDVPLVEEKDGGAQEAVSAQARKPSRRSSLADFMEKVPSVDGVPPAVDAGAADGKKGWAAQVTGMGRKVMDKAKAGAAAGWESHGKRVWEEQGKPAIADACDKHVKPAHGKMHAAYNKIAGPVKAMKAAFEKHVVPPMKKHVIAPVKKHVAEPMMGAARKVVLKKAFAIEEEEAEDPFARALEVEATHKSVKEKVATKLRGAKAKIMEKMPKMDQKKMRHAGYGLALASCLGKQCGCGPWNVMRGMIKLALKPLTKRLNATVYGAALVGCLGFLASKDEGQLEDWCSSGCGMQDAMNAATKKANEMAPSEEQVQAGLEGLQAGMMEDLAELKARVMNRKTTNPEDDDKENAAAEENADNGEVGAVGADGANGGRRRAMEAVHHV